MVELAYLTVNAGKARRATLYGRSYLVAPLTMIVPGVLHGTNGPLLYPEEHVSKDPPAWNHMPIVVGHPVKNGANISARDPEVLEKYAVGLVLRSNYNGRLRAEGWFSVDDTRRVDSRILDSLEAGEKIELSTGLFLDVTPDSGTYNGRPYTGTTSNYRPDHLAVLPDSTGACSIADGCGVLANSGVPANASGALGNAVEWPTLVGNPKGRWKPPPSGDAPAEVKRILRRVYSSWRDAHPSEDPATKTRGARIAWAAVRKAGWRKGADGKWHKMSNRMSNSGITAHADLSITEKYDLVYRAFREAHPTKYDADTGDPLNYCSLTEVFDSYLIYYEGGSLYRQYYSISESGTVTVDGTPEPVRRITEYVPNSRGATMPLTPEERQVLVNDLSANCNCWKGEQELLSNFTDEKLAQLKAAYDEQRHNALLLKTATTGYVALDGKAIRVNPETGKWEDGVVKGRAVKNKDEDDEEEEEEYEAPAPKRKRPTTASAPQRPQSVEDALRMVGPDALAAWHQAQEVMRQEKEKVISQILANSSLTDMEKRLQYDRLQRRSLDELRQDLSMLPKSPRLEDLERPRRRRPPVEPEDEDRLDLPSIQWNSVAKDKPKAANEDEYEEEEDPEWVTKLSPRQQAQIRNAMAIEGKERRRLIDQLLANVSDESEQDRLAVILEDKNLDELQVLVSLARPADDRRPIWAGSAAPPPPGGGNRDADDVLAIPKMEYERPDRRKA